MLADRGFASYVVMALLNLQGVQSAFRLHWRRLCDFRKGKRLGKNDRLLIWEKPQKKPRYLSKNLWNRLPEHLPVRLLRYRLLKKGFRCRSITLATTLLDAQSYSGEQLAALYARRWQIELWFRDIKTTLGMEVLRTQSPEMVHKELEMHLTAYNLLRALMAQSARLHAVALESLSFKGSLDATRQFSMAIAQAASRKKQRALIAQLLKIIARDQVPQRPGRREPRAVKRRPKPFPILNHPRKNSEKSLIETVTGRTIPENPAPNMRSFLFKRHSGLKRMFHL